MNKALESLENMKKFQHFECYLDGQKRTYDMTEDYETVKKIIKAFEIIKQKKVRLDYLMKTQTYEQYNHAMKIEFDYKEEDYIGYLLSQEEFDLLKETLR